MSPTFSTREYERALLEKGFRHFRGGSHKRLELYIEGAPTGIKTLVSHGNYDVSGYLQISMVRQLRMPDTAYLRRFVSCEISLADYLEYLRSMGHV